MIDIRKDFEQRYLSGLLRYLAGEGEAALQNAYEVGRQAITQGLGGLEMLAIHQRCLAVVMRSARSPLETARVAKQAGNFFAESLSPFEMALRGFQEANARLSRNLEELRAAHRALEMERGRYRDLFDFAPDGYLVTDLAGRIEEANQAAATLLGVSGEFFAGTGLFEFVVEESRDAFETRLKQMGEGDAHRVQEWQFDIRSRHGASFPATLSVRAVRDSSGLPVSLRWLLRDVSDRKRMEEERAQSLVREQVARAHAGAAERFAFLAEIGSLLVASLDCDTTLGAAAQRIVPYLADLCVVYLVEPDDKIRMLASAHSDQAHIRPEGWLSSGRPAMSPGSIIVRMLRDGHGQIFAKGPRGWRDVIESQPELFGFFLEHDLESLMLVPMLAQERALGLIVLGAVEACRYKDDHLALAEDLARRCALAVDNTRLYRAMIAERDKAAEAGRAKDDFLGILGHEVRNPLVPILGWARKLKKDPAVAANPLLSQGVDTLERNARNILRLADDCLDLVRISERKVALNRELLDLNHLVQSSIEALRLSAQEKGLRVVTNLAPCSLRILGDRSRLEQVMSNLLINAIKYTEAGGLISVSCSRDNDDAAIEVKDTGIGIAAEFLEQVFQPFRRGTREWLTSEAGLGLGLAIAHKIITMHGGAIWAESPGLGGGCTFHFRLPMASAEIQAPAAGVPAPSHPSQAGAACILLIDDQQDVADLMKMELDALGYRVLTATDGHTGLEMAMRDFPDVIISDIKMPRMDGYELIQSLRRTPRLASVPVIALTGLGTKKHVTAALAAGYDAHLNKPVEVSELSDLIQSLLAQRRARSTQA